MRLRVLLIAIIFVSFLGYSQEAEWLSGELHLVDGTVKKGQVKVPQPTKVMRIGANKVAYKANKKSKNERFKDDEIAFVYLKSKQGETCKYVNILVDDDLTLFKEVEIIGDLTIYARSMEVGHSASFGGWFTTSYNEFYVMREGEKKATEILSATRGIGFFQKNVKKYFSNCQQIINASETVKEKDQVLEVLQLYKECS